MRLVAAEDGHRPLHVGLAALDVTHAPLRLAAGHIAGLKVRVLLQNSSEIVDGLAILAGAHVQQGTVVECHEVGRVILQDKTKVTDGLVVIPYLGTQQSTVEVGLLARWVEADGVVIVGHGAKVVIQVILHECTVDEVTCITGFKQDCAIHIGQGTLKVVTGAGGYLGTHDIGARVFLAQGDAAVQVLESRCRVLACQVHLSQTDVSAVMAPVQLQQAVKGRLGLIIVLQCALTHRSVK